MVLDADLPQLRSALGGDCHRDRVVGSLLRPWRLTAPGPGRPAWPARPPLVRRHRPATELRLGRCRGRPPPPSSAGESGRPTVAAAGSHPRWSRCAAGRAVGRARPARARCGRPCGVDADDRHAGTFLEGGQEHGEVRPTLGQGSPLWSHSRCGVTPGRVPAGPHNRCWIR
jgi:hypothetical protein